MSCHPADTRKWFYLEKQKTFYTLITKGKYLIRAPNQVAYFFNR